MDDTKERLKAEIRYAQRLCQRTARLYRRAQTSVTFLSLAAGSATLVTLCSKMAPIITMLGGALFAIFAVVNYAIRPADKIAQNEGDIKKYSALLVKAETVSVDDLKVLLAEARLTDVPEVEPLREVAFNDVMHEINRADAFIALTPVQRLLKALA